MAVLHQLFSTTTISISSFSHPSLSSSSIAPSNSYTRLHKKSISVNQKLFNGPEIHTPFNVKQRFAVIVKVSDVDGMGTVPESPPPSENEDEKKSVGVEDLPLESNMQLKVDQKLRMKLAKKIRLRRKRLVRKRHLRKKGRWPPSKMKKNKNV